MALGRASIDLWRRSRPFRMLAAAAAVCTVLAAVTGLRGGGTGGQVAGGGGGGGGGQVAGSVGGGGAPPPVPPSSPASCGPPAPPARAVPSVVGAPGSAPPSHVSVPQTGAPAAAGGPPSDVMARFRQFVTRVDAAAREQREGERCARMADAIQLLEPNDYAWADCFPDGQDKLVLAQDCNANFAASEARFARLEAAAAQAGEDGSAASLERLADARAAMTPFDSTREAWSASGALVEAGDDAARQLDASTARIARLEAAASAAGAAEDPAATRALAEAGALTSFDIARLTAAQSAMLDRSRAAGERLAESDARFERLAASLAGLSADDPAARDALITAVSRLDAFDLARADAAQAADIASARASATRFALNDLVAAAGGIDPATATAAQLDRLRDLRAVILRNDLPETLTPEQSAALDVARVATARREASDRRLAEMRATVDRVETGGPAALGEDVLRAHAALTDLDLSRMDAADEEAYAALEAAREVTLATRDRALTRDVPVFVRGAAEDAPTRMAVDGLRTALRRDGFLLVTAEERSAVTFTVGPVAFSEREDRLGNSVIRSARVSIEVDGRWTFADQTIPVPPAEAEIVGRGAAEEVIPEAVAELAGSISALAR